jgi:diguanylate cyclase (GGDEF)-like protein
MTLTLDEIIASINHLVLSVIPADKVDVFIFDMEDRLLKKVRALGQPHREEVSVPLGEGLVGMAAQEGTVKIRGRGNIESSVQKISHDSHIWMAVPIRFRERLFGVIGIGQVKNPLGNESNIMKMIADIAGVALINRSLLGEAKHEANTDPLTGLHNRRYFHQMAQVLVEKSIREGNTPISIFLFDIDHFKHYNDINGHDEGDKVLKELSKFVREVTRKDSVVARFGGEEFIIMLPGVSKDDAFVYADRLREQICAYPFAHREKQPLGCLSISGGIASFPIDGGSMNRVIKLADTCLYSAKFEGRNRIAIYKPFYFSDLGKEEEKGKVNGHVQENQQG